MRKNGHARADKRLPPHLAPYRAIADALSGQFGRNCEAVLHDLRRPTQSLVYIAGNLTGRRLGAPITDTVLEALRHYGDAAADMVGYLSRGKDGRLMKSSTVFIRDGGARIVGCLCINLDLTSVQMARGILDEMLSFADAPSADPREGEYFAEDVEDLVSRLLDKVVNTVTTPIALMNKSRKMDLVAKLEKRGVFLVKGAVEQVAHILGVSRYTVYSYIDKIRSPGAPSSAAHAPPSLTGDHCMTHAHPCRKPRVRRTRSNTQP